MNQTTITRDDLDDLMAEIDVEVPLPDDDDDYFEGDYLLLDYSGRCMYGDECPGIVCANPTEVMFHLGVEIGRRAVEEDDNKWSEIGEAFARSAQDSMGRSSIVYFPRLAVEVER